MNDKAIVALLQKRIGLDIASVGEQLIRSAVDKRKAALKVGSEAEYLQVLQRDDSELSALVEEVVIPESWFFRDVRPFERLQEFARSFATQADQSKKVMRILSLPSAAGEEAYSIAIALSEIGMAPSRFAIDGVDVSARVIEQAQRGQFRRNAFRGATLEKYGRYFVESPAGWEIKEPLRGAVRFRQGNVLDPGCFPLDSVYDVIFCRNLLIYLTDRDRQHVIDAMDRLLAKDGILFVGHAESIALLQPRFTAVADRGSFAYVRAPVPLPMPKPPAVMAQVRKQYRVTPAKAQSQEVPRPALLDEAGLLADRKQYGPAIQRCEQAIRKDGPSARAYVLLGSISLAQGEAEAAEQNFLKAVYLDNAAEVALLSLALISERRGDKTAAARYRSRAERAHQSNRDIRA